MKISKRAIQWNKIIVFVFFCLIFLAVNCVKDDNSVTGTETSTQTKNGAHGKIVFEDQEPAVGITLVFSKASRASSSAIANNPAPATTTTDVKGEYQIDGLENDVYNINAIMINCNTGDSSINTINGKTISGFTDIGTDIIPKPVLTHLTSSTTELQNALIGSWALWQIYNDSVLVGEGTSIKDYNHYVFRSNKTYSEIIVQDSTVFEGSWEIVPQARLKRVDHKGTEHIEDIQRLDENILRIGSINNKFGSYCEDVFYWESVYKKLK